MKYIVSETISTLYSLKNQSCNSTVVSALASYARGRGSISSNCHQSQVNPALSTKKSIGK
uniref:Uncharacterized protein n=1 Tax=Arion vulgaris TaxID=1028688 RepID=A0A0B7B7T3_9EUPU